MQIIVPQIEKKQNADNGKNKNFKTSIEFTRVNYIFKIELYLVNWIYKSESLTHLRLSKCVDQYTLVWGILRISMVGVQ